MENIIQNWRKYENRQPLLENPEHISGVLGIKIPLNESSPYSYTLTEQILQEQLLYEGFLDSAKEYLKQKSAPLRDFFATMVQIVKDPAKISSYIRHISRKIIRNSKSAIDKVLDKLGSLGAKIKAHIDTFVTNYDGMESGWKKALAGTTIAILLAFIKEKFIDKLTAAAEDDPAYKELIIALKEKVIDFFDIRNVVAKTIEKVQDIRSYLGWIGPVVGGVNFVSSVLAPVTSRMTTTVEV